MNRLANQSNTAPLIITLENPGEIHYVYSNTISPIGIELGEIGLMATITFVAAKKWFVRKSKSVADIHVTQEIETDYPRTFSCARFYERFEKADPFEGQYDHWVIAEPLPRKSAKDMTREEILAEAGIPRITAKRW
ncbi:hypothetical protein [Allocoleopsis sp.]|uniref:hypothetical protein n=1 Tax=Allocoleopsis sp. TaxID=3088169 RepID=UPI002FD2A59F